MKLVILTSNLKRHNYFAKNLIDYFEKHEILLIRQSKLKKKTPITVKKFLKVLKNKIFNIIFNKYSKKFSLDKKKAEEHLFKDYEFKIFEKYNIKLVNTEKNNSINSLEYVNMIKSFHPDIIVVMGTSLLSNKIIELAKYKILNLHTGLSPNYRGDLSNLWPIINNDYINSGVTIHELDTGIDSGKIVFRKKVFSREKDFPKVNCKAIVYGTFLMKKAVKNIIDSKHNSFKQESGGKLYYVNDFNAYIAKKYYNIRNNV